jgi:putative DNA methylase
MDDFPRLIEHGFPLRETSLASVHEKNVRHGHISTLHIWPARRPLAACRAALVATLLPDPGDPKKRAEIFKRLAGTIPENATSAKEIEGGILLWGKENGADLQWFRDEIRKAYGGRSPRVLDPFAGGGAIPLEAMRLGCETTAMDINPVAWFVLKCTLEYPQRFAGKLHPLPEFVRSDDRSQRLDISEGQPGDLSAHVQAWGHWVLERARADLAGYYPMVDGKPTVAYLWARTVRCKNCRATVPLLKTRWLSRSDKKAVALTMKPKTDGSGVEFDVVQIDKKQRSRYDASGTMNSSGVRCPCCPAQMTMAELRIEGKAERMGTVMTAVVVEGTHGKEYRLPTELERERAKAAADAVPGLFSEIPFGLPTEPLPSAEALGFRVPLYGIDRWDKLFTPRQLLAIGTFVKHTRALSGELKSHGYDEHWIEAILALLACVIDRAANYLSMQCIWEPEAGEVKQTFLRYALPILWDFGEANPIPDSSRIWSGAIATVTQVVSRLLRDTACDSMEPSIVLQSALAPYDGKYDVIVTDPPYYDAIPYSDLMDFFYIWLRRSMADVSETFAKALSHPLSPKWDLKLGDGELIDDSSRFENDRTRSRRNYEQGMQRAFSEASESLADSGRFVVVFAHKNPAAWESLVAAMIGAGFVVDASWPIQTEMRGGVRNFGRASLSSSIWLVCKKRPASTRPGWDSSVREEMRENVAQRLREFWDAGIRGPDFVWSAIGPALEAFSRYPRVRKVDSPDDSMTVSDFLTDVRREVVGFAAARVLHRSDDVESDIDGPTTYYLLHRNDFQFEPVPVGASILYAVSCNLRDTALIDEYDLLSRPGRAVKTATLGTEELQDDDALVADLDVPGGEALRSVKADKSLVQLKQWNDRKRPSLGEDAIGHPAPLIDQIHRLMRLWKSGDVSKVNEYIAARGLSSDHRAREVIQAIIELAERATEERSILEAISNHLGDTRPAAEAMPALF